jgi:FtsP/CotA-like multicopper oxidase with cupredoxin domain
MSISRRHFLKTGLMAGTMTGMMGPGLLARAAQGSVREFRFTAGPVKWNLGVGPTFLAFGYNGRIPGPEIRVREGETIRVLLKNDLPDETTIHWHGLPVPNAMDGVPGLTQPAVPPGKTFVYEFPARPAGTYIYHSHVGYQLDQGLYGPLIVEEAAGGRSYDREYTLVLEDWAMVNGGGPMAVRRRPPMMGGMMRGMMRGGGGGGGPLWEPIYDGYAVNGRVWPATQTLTVKRGDRVRLRLINASSATIYYLRLAGHRLTITHTDGRPIQPVATDLVQIGMGERYDVEFRADNPGAWLLAARDMGWGESGLRIQVRYQGSRQSVPTPPSFDDNLIFATYWDMKSAVPRDLPSRGRARYYSQLLSGGMHSSSWTINGQAWPRAETLTASRGDRVRLDYVNRSPMPHPMHLHGHFFRLANPRLPEQWWVFKDTAVVHRMQRVAVDFKADNPGRWFHHCHNLYHMVAGMANSLKVG